MEQIWTRPGVLTDLHARRLNEQSEGGGDAHVQAKTGARRLFPSFSDEGKVGIGKPRRRPGERATGKHKSDSGDISPPPLVSTSSSNSERSSERTKTISTHTHSPRRSRWENPQESQGVSTQPPSQSGTVCKVVMMNTSADDPYKERSFRKTSD